MYQFLYPTSNFVILTVQFYCHRKKTRVKDCRVFFRRIHRSAHLGITNYDVYYETDPRQKVVNARATSATNLAECFICSFLMLNLRNLAILLWKQR